MDFIEKNATVFAELIQYLNDKSLSLVIKNVKYNGRKALGILRKPYLSKGKLKVISLYIQHFRGDSNQSIADYDKSREYF